MKRFITICALVLAVPLAGDAQEPKTGGQQQRRPPQAVAPDADKVLKEMGAAMAAAKRISFEAHAIADQLTPDGQKVQYAKNQKQTRRCNIWELNRRTEARREPADGEWRKS